MDIVRFELWKAIGGDEISDNQCSPTDSVVGTGQRGGAAEQALGFASLYYNRHCCQYFFIVTVVNIIVINSINSIITSSNMAVTIPLKTELLGLFLL